MKVLIMGLGHLASYIVNEQGNSDFDFSGTHRSQLSEKFRHVEKIFFSGAGEIPDNLNRAYDAIVWNYPPSFTDYPVLLSKAHKFFAPSIPWLFVSSTSVYSSGEVFESSERNEESLRGKRVIELELLVESFKREVTIIRPAGLMDKTRNPAFFFGEGKIVPSSLSPVNFVHTRDVARFILFLCKRRQWGESYNLCASDHPTKESFYGVIKKKYGQKSAQFDGLAGKIKIVRNDKSKALGFSYLCDIDITEFEKVG